MSAFVGSTTALSGNATWTSPAKSNDRFDYVSGTVFSDQAGTIHIEQSSDGVNWDVDTSYSVTANDGKGFKEDLLSGWWRIRFVNGSSAQNTFRIFARMTSGGDS